MKQSYFVIIWLVGIFVLGCRSEDDDLPLIEDSVEGTWELREVTLQGSGSANVALSPFPVPVTFTGNGADYDMQLVFAENPQVVTALGSVNVKVQVAAIGINMASRTLPIIGSEAFKGSWSQERGDLVLTGNQNSVRFKLLELKPTMLIFAGNPNLKDFDFAEGDIRVNEATFRFVFDR